MKRGAHKNTQPLSFTTVDSKTPRRSGSNAIQLKKYLIRLTLVLIFFGIFSISINSFVRRLLGQIELKGYTDDGSKNPNVEVTSTLITTSGNYSTPHDVSIAATFSGIVEENEESRAAPEDNITVLLQKSHGDNHTNSDSTAINATTNSVVTLPVDIIGDRDSAKNNTNVSNDTVQDNVQDKSHEQETTEEVLILPQKTTEFIKEYIDTKLDATDRIKNVVASRLRVMEASPDIIEQMKKIDISIVISHCEAPLSWIPEYIGEDYSIKDITIYSKCGNEVNGIPMLKQLSPSVNIIALPNLGREGHTYAYYIREHYRSIEKEESNGDDIVLFLKDNSRFLGTYDASDVLFSHVSGSGFACLTPPRYCLPDKDPNLYDVTMQHSRVPLLENFTLPEYSRTDRETNEAFQTDKYTSLKNWTEEMGFIIPESETIPVCLNGMFAAQKKQFLNQPEEAWENMVESLSRANNLIEGHYAERMWASILSDNDEESAKAVDEVLSPHIGFISIGLKYWALKGQVYIMKNMTAHVNQTSTLS